MRMPAAKPSDYDLPSGPSVDALSSRSLYRKTSYAVETDDHWELVVTRYQPAPQDFFQPLLAEPILLMHGFSQNRHAWTSGEFVKNLLYFGADIHILELRGHGKSSIELQRQRAEKSGQPVPMDLDYGWDIDSYFLYDLPACVAAVKRITERDRIFFCGHSMGGMLGYGYAGLHDDFEGLITIGSAADLGRGFPLLRAIAFGTPVLSAGVDLAFASVNLQRRVSRAGLALLNRAVNGFRKPANSTPHARARELSYKYVPVDTWLKWAERLLGRAQKQPIYEKLNSRVNKLTNPSRVSAEDIRWLMRWGGEREPRKVLDEFTKWIRRDELCCYRTGHDFKKSFANIKIPMAIIFGDLDPLASVASTRSVYRAAQSDYLLWRPVKGNSHIELTMGHDIRQICYDIKNLVEYARTHRDRRPSLPRVR